jgi:hypothetical protein
MKYLRAMIFAASASLCATIALAQEGQPCDKPGAVYTIGGKQFICSGAAGQARDIDRGRGDFDGRSKDKTQPVGIPQPSGVSTRQAVFPGIDPNDYRKLANSPKGKELIKQADNLRAAQAQAEREFENLKRAGTAVSGEQLTAADRKVRAIGNEIKQLQPKAQLILVELR